MLLDTAARLPEVLKSIREELSKCRNEKEILEGKRKYRNPDYLKRKLGDLLQRACKRVGEYLDGDLEAAVKFPESLMDLDDELDREDESEWADRTLGSAASVEDEEKWRELIHTLIEREEGLPDYVYAEKKFIGGKQFQRAKELMKAAMLESFPNVGEMKDYVASGAGYLQGGLQRENWCLELTRWCCILIHLWSLFAAFIQNFWHFLLLSSRSITSNCLKFVASSFLPSRVGHVITSTLELSTKTSIRHRIWSTNRGSF